ncbi:MAG: hypothetical protein WC341_00510 [Bacteroidales bacterium]|jgi:hypothetical protein
MAYYKAKRKSLAQWKSWADKQPKGERGISRSIIKDWQSSEDAIHAEIARLRGALEEIANLSITNLDSDKKWGIASTAAMSALNGG